MFILRFQSFLGNYYIHPREQVSHSFLVAVVIVALAYLTET